MYKEQINLQNFEPLQRSANECGKKLHIRPQ